MFSYLRQVAICESVRETIRQGLAQSTDVALRLKANHIPTTDGILRMVSLFPKVDTEERLKDLIIEHVLDGLRLTPAQREHLHLNS
jgi:hypothetical protein